MVIRAQLALIALAFGAGSAAAESRGHALLAAARTAIGEVRYDDARRLLGEALAAGDNGPEDVTVIYALSARTAIVFDQRDVAQQFYRRWLELEPTGQLPADSSPKLRDELEAARAFVVAHGRLMATASRRAARVEVVVRSDAVGLVHAARLAGGEPVRLTSDHRAWFVGDAPTAELVDDYGNLIATLDVTRELPMAAMAAPPSPARSRAWMISSILLGSVAAGFGIGAAIEQHESVTAARDSGGHRKADAETAITRARELGIVSGIAGALAIGCAGIVIAGSF